MNRLKTFLYYGVTYILVRLAVIALLWLSDKFYDSIPDIFYMPLQGAVFGYLPFIIGAQAALDTTNNYEGTRKILWIYKTIIASNFLLFGLMSLFNILDTELFFSTLIYGEDWANQVYDELDRSSDLPHWLYNIPVAITAYIAAYQVRKDDIPF